MITISENVIQFLNTPNVQFLIHKISMWFNLAILLVFFHH